MNTEAKAIFLIFGLAILAGYLILRYLDGNYSWQKKNEEKSVQDENLPPGFYLEYDPVSNKYRWVDNDKWPDMCSHKTKKDAYECAWNFYNSYSKTIVKPYKWKRI